jgi:hypothetical protein
MGVPEDLLNNLDDPHKRLDAIVALGQLKHQPALDRILAFANDRNPHIRAAVMTALVDFDGDKVSSALNAGRNDADENVRTAAEGAWAAWILRSVLGMTGAERGYLVLKNPQTGAMDYQAGAGIDAEQVAKPELVVSKSVIDEVVRSQQALLTDNASQDSRFQSSESIVAFSLRQIIAVPIKSGDEVIGVVYGDKRLMSGLFNQNDLHKVTEFAAQASAQAEAEPIVLDDLIVPEDPSEMSDWLRGGGSDEMVSPEPDFSEEITLPPPSRPLAPITPITPPSTITPPLNQPVTGAEKTSEVQFSAFFPPEAQVNHPHGLYVYAHLPGVLDAINKDVERFRQELGGEVPKPKTAKQTARLQHETPITLVPECDELEFEPASLTKKWREDWVRFDFDFRPTADVVDETVMIRVSVMVRGIEIAHINCPMKIVQTIQQPVEKTDNPLRAARLATKTAKLYDRIFVSYSRRDTQVAEAYRLAQMAIGNDVFMDSYSIRVGEDWRAALATAIDEADIFQLFWSNHAAESENVQHEWDYALKYKCPDQHCASFIRPVFWDKPMPQPPEPLSHLNFRFVPLRSTEQTQPIDE